jgi:hypothetical protein
MKVIKKIIAVLAVLALVSSPVLAATTDQTNLSLAVAAGALSVTSDESAALAGVSVSTASQDTYTGTGLGNDASDILVTSADTRGESAPSGWSTTATVTDLINASSDTIDVTNFTSNFSTIRTNSGDNTGISAGTGAVLVDADDDGTSDVFSVTTASAENGQGEYEVDMGLDLTIPANQQAGTYAGTVDLSIQ